MGCVVAESEGIVRRCAEPLFHDGCGLEWEDLLQEGRMGLVKALRVYDPKRGSWSTLAYFAVRSHMHDAIKKARRQRRGIHSLGDRDIAGNGDPLEHLASAEVVELVRTVLARLGRNGRMVDECVLKRRSFAEVAREEGVGDTAIIARVRRGLREIAAYFGGGGCADVPWVRERMK